LWVTILLSYRPQRQSEGVDQIRFDRFIARPGTAALAGLALLGGLLGALITPLAAAAAGSVTLSAISTGFPSPIGIDYYQPTNQVIMSVNYFSGQPNNFVLVAADGTQSQFSSVAGLADEVYVVAIRPSSCQGGFTPGDVLVGTGTPGVIAKLTNGGATRIDPWVTLAGEGGLLRGGLVQDSNCVAGGDLIATTTAGDVWRVTSAGGATELATGVGDFLEGPTTVPNGPRYGPWAGQILAASEGCGCVRSIDPTTGAHSTWGLGQANMTGSGVASAEGIHVVPANENFYGVDFGSGTLQGASYTQFSGMVGDIVVATEFPGRLVDVAWSAVAGAFTSSDLLTINARQWEGTAFAPAGIPPIPPAPPAVPGPPQNVSVIPGNGFADVSWQPPLTGAAAITGYIVTTTPTYNNRRPSPNASTTITFVANSTSLSWTVQGLLKDCHQRYVVSVAAATATGNGPAATSASFRPSGIVLQGSPPPYVVVLLDGVSESKPRETFDPYKPTLDGTPSYCPESWNSSSGVEAEADLARTPNGPWEFFNKWNFADPGSDNVKGSNSTPRELNSDATPTHEFMLDAIAAEGAVILPYSYTQALLTQSPGSDPTFSFDSYSNCDSTPPGSPVFAACSRRSIDDDVATLDKEIASIHTVWSTSDIIVLGHSQGGLVAFEWWLKFGPRAAPGSAAAAVGNVFTLDSPVNGVCYTPICLGPTGYPQYNPAQLRYARDRRQLALDAAAGYPVHFLGTSGDTVPIVAGGAYGPPGPQNLQHDVMVTGSKCVDQINNADCPPPADHISGCPIASNSPQWVKDDQHFIVKFCPDDVAYLNATLGLSY
jgi:hypothetical protein